MQKIVCAANKVNDHIVCGVRHYDTIMTDNMFNITESYSGANVEQGFVDNKGNFLTREEAWKVAVKAQQIYRLVGNQDSYVAEEGTLYSENLY